MPFQTSVVRGLIALSVAMLASLVFLAPSHYKETDLYHVYELLFQRDEVADQINNQSVKRK